VICVEVFDYAVIFGFLTACYWDSVYFTWDRIKFAESSFADYFLIECGRERKTTVSPAKAVHFGKSFIGGQGNMIVWFFGKESEKSCRSCSCLSHDEVDVFCQEVSSFASVFYHYSIYT